MKTVAYSLRWLLAALMLVAIADSRAQAVIVVYDLGVDFSDTNNPNGTWEYLQGSTPLAHFTPVPLAPLVPAVANGYWGASANSLNTSLMQATANGSATGFWSNNDFLTGDMLVRTTDPASGAPVVIHWTAPSAGSFTYAGFIWNANAPLGPASNDFAITFNAGPAIESGTATLANNINNPVGTVNGINPILVQPGDVLALTLSPSIGQPFGSLSGVSLTIDFTPVPEPGTLALGVCGGLGLLGFGYRRMARRKGARLRSIA